MKNKRLLAILALTIACSLGATACGFGKKEQEDVVVDETVKEEKETEIEVGPTDAPEPTAAPNLQVSTYTSADGAISIELPDATWGSKADQADLYSFDSPEQGSILIEHGAGEADMATQIIPKTQDTAETLEKGSAGTDYEIQNYMASEDNGNAIYTYVVKSLSEEDDFMYKVNKVLANASEFYFITGTVLNDDADVLAKVQSSMDTFTILDDASTLKELTARPALDGTEGTVVTEDGEEEKTEETESTEETAPADNAAGGIVPSRDNPDNSDNTKTRTIYSNDGSGTPIVVTLNGEGVWVDASGNQYRFQGESDVYDQNDVSYYYHGEAADVYFMPVE